MTIPLVDMYKDMLRIRKLEEEIFRLRLENSIVGSVHLCNGQEAIYVGAAAALDLKRDAVFPTYRGHGWALALGLPPRQILAELLGRSTGVNAGRGGSAYFSAPDHAMYGENSIVGAGAPIAAGAALASTFDGSGRVAVASFGDGTLNQGSVHEAMNFAAIRDLPVVFIVENNSYSEMTPISAMVKNDVLFKRAAIYGFTGARVDGNDPEAMHDAMATACERARSGKGPVLVEAMTARIVGHYIGDAQTYRTKNDLDKADREEPIGRAERTLLTRGYSQGALDEISHSAHQEIAGASQLALSDPLASTHDVLENLYA
ncbi:thiamine pyrophosphate-dependent dehydrogenase E1 component subunit alpha [Arthrobacter sp. 4R501]|uniref:thiamine pyrophosphate-dependent dehydrogenase E1 component subunit alpha n=1 Tax=Arthrobacter sp. 4R501 TaxID=2058886 RepID=UPI000CE476B4|nr:thiamine pyrophosphate-dependent dehydrogenase E1 component subunit alpha [Arthrobacter sp. 4R501]